MAGPVLVVAAVDDWPTDRVVEILAGRGVEVFRLDGADFPQQIEMAVQIDTSASWRGDLANAFRAVHLEDVRAIWYRTPGRFVFPAGMSQAERNFAAEQAQAGLGGVLSALDCRWVSHPRAMARAEYKPLQLAAARRCGLAIPPTLITNRADAVREFAAAIDGPLICKTLASPVLVEHGELKTVYTHRLTQKDLEDLAGLSVTAHLFQAWIDKAYEVRLTVVGDRLLAAGVHAGSEQATEDWRSDYPSLTYSVADLPAEVSAAVHRLMEELQLRFAAIDMIVDPDGRHWFLEANPCGQWDWIQHETGLPIAEAIADELQGAAA